MQEEMTNDHLRDAYRSMDVGSAPSPWRRVPIYIAGVVAVGYGPGTEWLLVLTHSGLGVVETATGATVARQTEADSSIDDPYPIAVDGIGPLAGQRIPIAGLWGGGLRANSPDGWGIYRVAPNWPTDCAVLCPPGSSDLTDPSKVNMLLKDLDPPIRAIGFSDSGKSLVVANTELFLWTRDPSS